MFRAENGAVGVVVQHDEIRPPPDQDGKGTIQTGTDRGAQTLRPTLHGPQQGVRPFELAGGRAHLAATGEEGKQFRRRGVVRYGIHTLQPPLRRRCKQERSARSPPSSVTGGCSRDCALRAPSSTTANSLEHGRGTAVAEGQSEPARETACSAL